MRGGYGILAPSNVEDLQTMPLYEFYCRPCHTIFTFRSQQVDTATLPACPRCGKPLKREVSVFAHRVRGAVTEGEGEEGAASRMEVMAAQLGERLQALDDDDADPRDAVRMMRELAASGGMSFNKEVQEAMARIEAGEDPEKIDEEFREVFDSENPFSEGGDDEAGAGMSLLRMVRAPARDPNWHELRKEGEDA